MNKSWVAGKQFTCRELGTQIIPVSEANCARAVASVFAGFGDGPEVARLIAAAPDLLEALRYMVDAQAQFFDHADRRTSLAQARAAIAKATGEA